MQTNNIILEAKGLCKRFGQTVALDQVDLTICSGDIRGLIGENGSGKSTISSIVAGMQQADAGTMTYLGKAWKPQTMLEAQAAGISMILQEMNTIPGISVAANIYAGQEQRFARWGFVDQRAMIKAADEVLHSVGITHIHAADNIEQYNYEDRKLIEIARAINENTQLLIVDETTTALSHSGRELLYSVMRRMQDEGKAVLFISHDLEELMNTCNALTVLKDGHLSGTAVKADFDAASIKNMMVGREISGDLYRQDHEPQYQDRIVLELNNISMGSIRDFNMQLHEGEILGIGGLSGCGMHSIGRIAYGLERLDAGEVLVNGTPIHHCLDAIRRKVGYISKNRDSEALMLWASIRDNIMLPCIDAIEKRTYVSPAIERQMVQEQITQLRIKCNDMNDEVASLSGGNKQKVSFAKWIANDAQIIIMDCPTRGVDIGVKQAMYALMSDMKQRGVSILMISEELPELIGMSDRLIVMKDYEQVKEFKRSSALSEHDIVEYII